MLIEQGKKSEVKRRMNLVFVKLFFLIGGFLALNYSLLGDNNLLYTAISSTMLAIFLIINGVEHYKKNGMKGWTLYYFISPMILFGLLIYRFLTE